MNLRTKDCHPSAPTLLIIHSHPAKKQENLVCLCGRQRAQEHKSECQGLSQTHACSLSDSFGAGGQLPLFLPAVTTGFAGDPELLAGAWGGCGACGALPVPAKGCKHQAAAPGSSQPYADGCAGGSGSGWDFHSAKGTVCWQNRAAKVGSTTCACGTLVSDQGCSSAHPTGCS